MPNPDRVDMTHFEEVRTDLQNYNIRITNHTPNGHL